MQPIHLGQTHGTRSTRKAGLFAIHYRFPSIRHIFLIKLVRCWDGWLLLMSAIAPSSRAQVMASDSNYKRAEGLPAPRPLEDIFQMSSPCPSGCRCPYPEQHKHVLQPFHDIGQACDSTKPREVLSKFLVRQGHGGWQRQCNRQTGGNVLADRARFSCWMAARQPGRNPDSNLEAWFVHAHSVGGVVCNIDWDSIDWPSVIE